LAGSGPEIRRGERTAENPADSSGIRHIWDGELLCFKPFAAAVEHILEIGVERIQVHDQMLVDRFKRRIWIAMPAGQLRMSPHLYNSAEEIDRAAAVLNDLG
jgi:selenocysteine lyase/cysteine desulfurase